jgi:hypothetical protein
MSSIPAEPLQVPVATPGQRVYWALSCWLAGLVITFIGFVAWFHSGPWFANVEPRTFAGSDLKPVRGQVRNEGSVAIFERPAEDGNAIAAASLPPFDAASYRIVQVHTTGAYPAGGLQFVWRSQKGENTVRHAPVVSSGGRILPVTLTELDGWSGQVAGIGIIARGPLAAPLIVQSVELRPSSVWTTIDAMLSDWFEFEPWDGGSIHFMAGGNPSLVHPLSLFIGIAFLVGLALYLLTIMLGHTQFAPQVAIAIALLGWAAIDARWQWNLWKQLDLTRFQYAGKSWEDKRLAAEDGYLFEFTRAARKEIGATPAHIYVFSDDEYDRVRGAYHLYPLNVHVRPKIASLVPPELLKPGDVIVLYRKRGVQYVPAEKILRWDGNRQVRAQMLLYSVGNGVFRVLPPA